MTSRIRVAVSETAILRVGAAALGLALLLTFVPTLDIWASGIFYSTAERTWVDRGAFLQFMRSGVPPLIMGGVVFVLLVWIGGRITGGPIASISNRHIGFLFASLVAGPGLIVESVLKSLWGRARPRDVAEFGGSDVFTPAVWISDACEKNCSFVSGHAALGFWTTAFAFLLPAHWRGLGLAAGISIGALMGLARMAEGAHFLSDIVYAGLIVVGINVWLAQTILSLPTVAETVDGA